MITAQVENNKLEYGTVVNGFVWTEKAYYSRSLNDKDKNCITFGEYVIENGCKGEMGMQWVDLGSSISPRLECFDDSFEQLSKYSHIFKILSTMENFTKEQFVKVLLENGFVDLTKYEQK